jgi:hypothetical protein
MRHCAAALELHFGAGKGYRLVAIDVDVHGEPSQQLQACLKVIARQVVACGGCPMLH